MSYPRPNRADATEVTSSALLASIDDTLATILSDGLPNNGGSGGSSGGLTNTQLRASAIDVTGPLTNTQLRASAVDVTGPLTNTQLRASSVPVSGPLTSAELASYGPLTNTQLRATAVPVSGPLTDTQLRATAVPVNGPLTDTQLRATAVPVSGPLTDTELRATAVPVSGPWTDTELRATAVPVSGPLTDTELRATAVPVSGPLTDTELRATAVLVSGPLTDTELRATAVPVSGPLTDTELRATAVPVSGPLTDTELRATAVPVSGPLTAFELASYGPLTDNQLRLTPVDVIGPLTSTELSAYGPLTNTQLRQTPVPVSVAPNVVSAVNSSTDPLLAGSAFVGPAEDVLQYDSVVVAVKTDQDGTFTVQFSPDGDNWDSTITRYYRTAAGTIEAPHRFTITRRYVRVSFNNTSASNQTYLRLQVMYGSKQSLNAPTDVVLAQDFDAIAVRPTDFHTEVALGRRQDASAWTTYGYNADVDIGTEAIASWGGTMLFLTAGEMLSIVSSSTEDDDGASGARSIVVVGVDSNWNAQSVVYTMDGTTIASDSSTWIGINRVTINTAGVLKTNAGTINITALFSGFTLAEVPAGVGASQALVYYVPNNHRFLVRSLELGAVCSGAPVRPEVLFRMYVYSADTNAIEEVFRNYLDLGRSNQTCHTMPVPLAVGGRSIIYVTATTTSDNTSVWGRMSGELFRDVDA